ncbi:MAG: SpoIIE family protein phosphatase [Actinomycetota bacterium]|nr:SpoIIE family protein phosphatase [Actinomycetota bacterium]
MTAVGLGGGDSVEQRDERPILPGDAEDAASRRREDGAQASRLDYRLVLDAFSDAVVAADEWNRIVYVNRALEMMLRWRADELIGRPLTMLMPERLREAHLAGFSRWVATHESRIMGQALRVPALRRDGTEVEIELTLGAVTLPGGAELVVGSLRDLRDWVELELQTTVARRLLGVLSEATTVAETGPRILQALAESVGWDVGSLWIVDRQERRLRCASVWHAPSVAVAGFASFSMEHTFPRGIGLPGRVWADRAPVWIHDVAYDPDFPRAGVARAEGLHGGFAFPIISDGRFLGVIELFSREPRQPDPHLQRTMSALGVQLGRFIERRLVEDALRASRERLDLALEAGQMGTWEWDAASDSLTLSDTLKAMIGLEAQTFDGSVRQLATRLHPEDRRRVLTTIRNAFDRRTGHHVESRIVAADGNVRWVEARGQVVYDDAGHVTGMAGVAMDITNRKAAEEERAELLRRERAARGQIEESRRRIAFLAEASAVLSSSLDHSKTLAEVARLAVRELADCCVVHATLEQGGIRALAIAHVDPARTELLERLEERYPVDPGSPEGVAKALRQRASQLYAEVTDELLQRLAHDGQHLRLLRELGLRSGMVVPLIARGRTLGAITLFSADSGRRYDAADLALAEDLARRAALAVDNARLYRERSRVADALQKSLLPPLLPNLPGVQVAARYRPAGEGEVGGDFYDLFPTRGHTWGIVMGDVRGKGAAAAAVTALVRYTVRAAAMHAQRPSRVLSLLNDAMLVPGEADDDTRFCTIVFARLVPRPEGAQLSVASGGHPLPLVLRVDGRVESVGGQGTLVGAFPDVSFTSETTTLASGDTMLLYTDGVTEARDGRELFGEERLRSLLASCVGLDAADVVERVERAVLKAQPRPRDDIALLALRVPPG